MILSFDIGGTYIKVAVLSVDSKGPLPALMAMQRVPVHSAADVATITQQLSAAKMTVLHQAEVTERDIRGVAVAMPGPADYLSGTLWMQHKFAALYGKSLAPIVAVYHNQICPPMAFINDADAFGLGEVQFGALQKQLGHSVLAITLGTGIGTALLRNGQLQAAEKLWDQPYPESDGTIDGGNIESMVGKSALQKVYADLTGQPAVSVRDIANRALAGETAAQTTYETLGARLATALAPWIATWQVDTLLFGGAIARSSELFFPKLQSELARRTGNSPKLVASQLGDSAAVFGAAAALQTRVRQFSPRQAIYLHGFASSPASSKAVAFAQAFATRDLQLDVPDLNLDLSGRADFMNLTVTRQLQLLARKTQHAAPGSVLLIGSSLGAYTASLFAARSDKVAALILMAPAFDLSARWRAQLGSDKVEAWHDTGTMEVTHYAYHRVEQIGWSLMADAAQHPPFPDVRVPTLIFHGKQDDVVDPHLSIEFANDRPNVQLELSDADHGLSQVTEHVLTAGMRFLSPWLR